MNLSEIDLNDLSFDNIGSWPAPVRLGSCVLLLIVICVLGYVLDIKSQQETLQISHHKEQNLKNTFEQKQRQSASLDAYRLQLKMIQQRFGDLLHQLPSKTEVPGLLEDISKNGIAAGLEFKLFDPQKEIEHDFYAELPIAIEVIGDYHQFGDFVSRLAGLNRIVTLHDFTIVPNKAASASKTGQKENQKKNFVAPLKMTLVAKTYRYIDKLEGTENEK